MAVPGDEEVLGLQVSVDDAVAVKKVDAAEDLPNNVLEPELKRSLSDKR